MDATTASEITMGAVVATAAATIGLLAVAFFQLRGIRADARIRNHPVLGAQAFIIVRDGRIVARLQNTGTGPAQNIHFRVWIEAGEKYLTGRELTSAGEDFWGRSRGRAPDFEHILSGIRAGQSDVGVYVGRCQELADAGGFGVIVYEFEHEDIFGERLPRTKPKDRRPGFANLVPEWDRELSGAPLDDEPPDDPEATGR